MMASRILGLVTGTVFGALLQRGGLSRPEIIRGQLLLRDGRVIETMATAIAVGSVAYHWLVKRGRAEPDVKPLQVGGVLGGAVLFGTGLAVLGYCPGTALAAVGEGRRDALAGVLGMLAGATAFVAVYPKLVPIIEAGGDLGKQTLPSLTTTPAMAWSGALAATTFAGEAALELARQAAR